MFSRATYIIILCISILVILSACGKDEPVELTRNDQMIVDSLFFAKKPILKAEADSICDESYDLMLQAAMDSVKAVRLKEINFILKK